MLRLVYLLLVVLMLKAYLHYGKKRTTLVGFEEHKRVFCIFRNPSLSAVFSKV